MGESPPFFLCYKTYFGNFLAFLLVHLQRALYICSAYLNDVCHRRLSVGYPLESASGYFYARITADSRLPFRSIIGAPSGMTLVEISTELAAVFYSAYCLSQQVL